MTPSRRLPIFLGITMLLAACQRDEIKTYRVAKETTQTVPPAQSGEMPPGHPSIDGTSSSSQGTLPPGHPSLEAGATSQAGMPGPMMSPSAGQSMADIPVATGTEDLAWTAPANWTGKALGQMRKGSFAVPGKPGEAEGDVSIFVFPGTSGGLSGNVNRWRGQIGLPPLSDEALPAALTKLQTTSGLELTLVDFSSPDGKRIIGAMLLRDSQSWFFKFAGSTALLEREKEGFVGFLKTIKNR